MWGKPDNTSTEPTNDWFAVPILGEDQAAGVFGPFISQDAAWDWLEEAVRERDRFDGGWVFKLESPQ